ncbi:prohibitin family protein [Ralstonia pseudosolanacearum]|uniref:prohibitin family protein n=1 Tax=Ralstonia pseudosolanacearum TaxID=1310165 RepID=UPI0007D75BF7|nr:prohibitin family protein [Ralstonia pseudosolanacearum]MDC6292236.1 prohibitin family protein [Ralstonia pseudosolanacearum]MDD7790112.1 prohibitin family protein [Ralstonia pseudosolanacearum]MDN3368604.1 prohibitin family protein [Ralstonia pseudosolanacearum]OAK93176.1 membrane protein [Ralstonia pseudosolanacearum]QOK88153.1 prohibitin family protein [Ralstonia pseudosolanacearum]
MPQVTASKLPLKLLALVFGAVLALAVARTFLLTWQIIPPGYTGIKINRLVDRGITRENVVTGFVFYNPVQTALIQYPTFVQRVIWTQDVNEGHALNEELTFNTKDAVPVNVDVAVSYQLDRDKVPDFYTNFRADRIDSFTHGYLRDTARNVIVAIGSEYSFDDMNGARKEEFVSRLTRELDARLMPLGVSIKQFGIVGSLRPPRALLDAVSAKTKAIQDAIRTENEVRSAQAEAKKKVAIAEGEAAANHALASSLDDRLLAWERLKLERAAIEKWNGVTPSVMGGTSGGGMLFNIPMGPQSR